MKEHPILFSPPMVRAILEGRKTQTRRSIENKRCGNWGAGHRLWVRETYACEDKGYVYLADGKYGATRWVPNIFMPRIASRITLEVTEIRVQRLQDISGEDALAEGVVVPRCGCEICSRLSQMCPADQSAHILAFAEFWDSINEKNQPWSFNPFVYAFNFNVIEQ
jgi:hypothetical protein